MPLNESIVEDAALEWFGELGYAVGHGPHQVPSESVADREPVLTERLRDIGLQDAEMKKLSKTPKPPKP